VSDVILAVLERKESTLNVLEAARRASLLMGRANIIALAIENAPQAGPLAAVLIAEVRDAAELREQDHEPTAWLKALFER
jgi:hypothetical protein